ncbi:hypothetical protein HY933_03010 [Candidatus Falkowbacteria bacterium]|nr:hypothetical protein [Candidatus Falkowbacteria bacterium]
MKIPSATKSILWDVDPARLDQHKDKQFLITRLADKGSWQDIVWLRKKYSLAEIKRSVRHSRNVSPKTKNFWRIM